jgi:ubiquinone/menaquinone biosynthesis C-methylase UbiE
MFRDLGHPPHEKLNEVGIQPGFHVLDYGCGPGSYTITAAELVGMSGKVYALDIHPLAIQRVKKKALKKRLTNIETIQSNCKTRLESNSIDVVLLYDIFHGLSDPESVLQELHRVMKPNSILSFSDHHIKEEEIPSRIPERLFILERKGKQTYRFLKV